jgi:hypothetical protein
MFGPGMDMMVVVLLKAMRHDIVRKTNHMGHYVWIFVFDEQHDHLD